MSTSQNRKKRDRKERLLNQQLLLEMFDYDPAEGVLAWKVSLSNRVKVGSRVTSHQRGQKRISPWSVAIRGENYTAHRVIWCMVYGYFPEHEIDHINRDPTDNRLENLREVSASCNIRNRASSGRSTTGITGVCPDKRRGGWRVTIYQEGRGGVAVYEGRDLIEAAAHRYAAEQCLDWHDCDMNSSARRCLVEAGILKEEANDKADQHRPWQ